MSVSYKFVFVYPWKQIAIDIILECHAHFLEVHLMHNKSKKDFRTFEKVGLNSVCKTIALLLLIYIVLQENICFKSLKRRKQLMKIIIFHIYITTNLSQVLKQLHFQGCYPHEILTTRQPKQGLKKDDTNRCVYMEEGNLTGLQT